MVQDRRLAHRVDPGLWARLGQVGAIADRIDRGVGDVPQGGIDGDKAVRQVQVGIGQPAMGPGAGGADGETGWNGGAIPQVNGVLGDPVRCRRLAKDNAEPGHVLQQGRAGARA